MLCGTPLPAHFFLENGVCVCICVIQRMHSTLFLMPNVYQKVPYSNVIAVVFQVARFQSVAAYNVLSFHNQDMAKMKPSSAGALVSLEVMCTWRILAERIHTCTSCCPC